MHLLGRALQVLGLVLPLTGLMLSLQKGGGMEAMSYEFGMLVVGAAVFWIGLQLQKKA
jgi:hypothetical protein